MLGIGRGRETMTKGKSIPMGKIYAGTEEGN